RGRAVATVTSANLRVEELAVEDDGARALGHVAAALHLAVHDEVADVGELVAGVDVPEDGRAAADPVLHEVLVERAALARLRVEVLRAEEHDVVRRAVLRDHVTLGRSGADDLGRIRAVLRVRDAADRAEDRGEEGDDEEVTHHDFLSCPQCPKSRLFWPLSALPVRPSWPYEPG